MITSVFHERKRMGTYDRELRSIIETQKNWVGVTIRSGAGRSRLGATEVAGAAEAAKTPGWEVGSGLKF